MATDPRFQASAGREVFTGNELLVKGALEAEGGVNLMTGYPGSPVAGFFDVLGDISKLLQEKGIRAFQANDEALGAAAVNGSQMLPWMKRKFFHCAVETSLRTCSRFAALPVAKLSSPTTRCSSFSKVSSRFEPIKPATPVTSQVFGWAGSSA